MAPYYRPKVHNNGMNEYRTANPNSRQYPP